MKRNIRVLGFLLLTLVGQANALPESQRVALFWNVEFDDDVRSVYREFDRRTHRTTSGHSEVGSTTNTEMGSSDHRQIDKMSEDVIENERGFRMLRGTSRPGLSPNASWRLEAAFHDGLQTRSLELLDRSTLMRMAGKSAASNAQVNLKALETAAVAAQADLLMQVLFEKDDASPIGTRFNVRITQLSTGATIAMLSTLALPAVETTVTWMPTSTGFEKKIHHTQAPLESYGSELARQVLMAL